MNRLLVFLFCALCIGTQAQTVTAPLGNSADAYWNVPLTASQKLQTVLVKSQTAIPDPSSAANTAVLNQQGLNNQAVVQTLGGTYNRLEVNQFNDRNTANAVLSGNNNSLIINQMGGDNSANVGLSGTNNRFMITQDGGDRVNMQGLQKDNTRLELIQGRGNNSFTLDNSTLFTDPLSKGIPNVRIEQSGGSAVTIQQGRVIGN
jgi:hypothetical protein